MRHYFTYFDSNYSPFGLSLYESLILHSPAFTLHIFCLDSFVHKHLLSLDLSFIQVYLVEDILPPHLLSIKSSRSYKEFIWSLTPFYPIYLFQTIPTLSTLTYLDADLYILNDLEYIYSGFHKSGLSILLTPHSFSPFTDIAHLSGYFCVQFLIFHSSSLGFLSDWLNLTSTSTSTSLSREDHIFGDQYYLTTLYSKFKDQIYILSPSIAICLAPWNLNRFPVSEAVLMHFHGFRILCPDFYFYGFYDIPLPAFQTLYLNYSRTLSLVFRKYSLAQLPISYSRFPRLTLLLLCLKLILVRLFNFFRRLVSFNTYLSPGS